MKLGGSVRRSIQSHGGRTIAVSCHAAKRRRRRYSLRLTFAVLKTNTIRNLAFSGDVVRALALRSCSNPDPPNSHLTLETPS
jgi:hypothetical protein